MSWQDEMLSKIGVVVIGRNEGERLRRCLDSVRGITGRVVYVDSGSTDGSVAMARAMSVMVVDLDMRIPFTAARARNAGFQRLRESLPGVAYVQFIDGDMELVEGWLEKAAAFLEAHRDVAVVAGHRRERHPERSIYNTLCAIDWDTQPQGEAKACGGDAMLRVEALAAVNGYRADLLGGEEPELCVRLRAANWRIWFLNDESTLHDAAITRFGQWWKRTVRGGYAVAQGVTLHGASPEHYCLRALLSGWFWGLGIPAAAFGLMPWRGMWPLALLLLYPLQIVRLAARGRRSPRDNCWYATFQVLGKFPEILGQMKFARDRCFRRQGKLIEYK
jgi:GT2 family glycosyltransferase